MEYYGEGLETFISHWMEKENILKISLIPFQSDNC